jgi:hypothetical protein
VVWIIGGCGGYSRLAALVGGITMYYVAHKVSKPPTNPALAVTRLPPPPIPM